MVHDACDAVIIGAGVSGCAVARELSRLDGRFCVVEAEDDVCSGTSKANSAIVHAGFDAPTGSLMARLNVEGSALFPQLSRDLDFTFRQIGSLVVCTDACDLPALEALLERGIANGVSDLRVIGRKELVALEPHIADGAVAALWAPTAGIVDPFGLTVALAENARDNGVDFLFGARVGGLSRTAGGDWLVSTARGTIKARAVINAAGVFADQIHNLAAVPAGGEPLAITPRRGEYKLLDTTAGAHVAHTIFMLPTKMGKGVLVTPTVHGNLLVGPTADDIDDKLGTDTTSEGLVSVREKSALTVKDIPFRETITSFSGLRAHQPGHEFLIGELPEAPGFIDCAGIESPGLSASPAIGRMVASIAQGILHLGEKATFASTRRGYPNLNELTTEEWNALIDEDPRYGTIVCRCCRVSEGQIREAVRRGARSLDAVKRRTAAAMGRCQAGFCTPRIMELICEEADGVDMCSVTKAGPGSKLVVGLNKGDAMDDSSATDGTRTACSTPVAGGPPAEDGPPALIDALRRGGDDHGTR